MLKIKRALISVSDKTGIVDFCLELHNLGIEIISTGGTAKLLKEAKIPAIEISDYTGFPEMLDGRVKTLHPKIHGGLLALRNNPEHMQTLKEHNIGLIDMVVVNLYPFSKVIQKEGVSLEETIENIDIGGPSMLRSAAKNYKSVAVISHPQMYQGILEELKNNNMSICEETLTRLGVEVFRVTSGYDQLIHQYLEKRIFEKETKSPGLTDTLELTFSKVQELRYGENPHQKAAFYRDNKTSKGIFQAKQLWGKELSFNNIFDLDATCDLVREFSLPAAVIIKHNNPCGVAQAATPDMAFKEAHRCDSLSAFGGIVGFNQKVEVKLAKVVAASGFLECIIAPGFDLDALAILKEKKNLRLLEWPNLMEKLVEFDFKKVSGGLLLQDKDLKEIDRNALTVVTKRKPTKAQLESLLFGWKVAKHVKSNAIVLTRGTRTVGIGAGQMSRVDSVTIATIKAGKSVRNSCLASDAFFPKEDAVIKAAKSGVQAIIQPGGSISDTEIIKACDKHGIAMVFTGVRHFKH